MNGVFEDPAWVCVRRHVARPVLAESSLVLSAVEIPHRLEFDGHHWCLFVPLEALERSERELGAYLAENRGLPTPTRPAPPVDSGWLGVLGYLLVIWALPWLEDSAAFGWHWREIGVLHAGAVRDGAWWRTVTALTLHADLGHIAANSLFGAVFGLIAGRLYGSGVAWLLILLAGTVGNVLNAAVQPDSFRSLGASTATFAALAMVGAAAWRRGYYRGGGWRRTFAPVFGGIAMLAYTGFGGENTDVVAHLTGFASGFLVGCVTARWPVARGGAVLQAGAAGLAFAIVIVAWRTAAPG